jgi:hypothetical protein
MTPYIASTRARSGPVIAANDRLTSWPVRGGTDILGHLPAWVSVGPAIQGRGRVRALAPVPTLAGALVAD